MSALPLQPLGPADEPHLSAFRRCVEALVHPVEEVDYAPLVARLVVGRCARGGTVLEAGQPCAHVYFVAEGLTRHLHRDRGEEGTVWFSGPGELMTEPTSFWGGQPSPSSIVALTDVVVLGLARPHLDELYALSPVWERLGRRVSEHYLLALSERTFQLQFRSARQRFEELLRCRPGLFQQVPLGHIASYLGMAPETLSRLRAEV